MLGELVRPALLLALALAAAPAFSHCDTLSGPVVKAARDALSTGDANLVLLWVDARHEGEVRGALAQAVRVRALGGEAQEVADRFFLETVVRIHRAGEGEPFTGLSDAPAEPIVLATDLALEKGSAAELEHALADAVRSGLAKRFAAAREARAFRPGDVAAGRAFVASYVDLTHWASRVHDAAADEHAGHGMTTPHSERAAGAEEHAAH